MGGDLISLRVLMVSAFRPTRDLWRQSAALASVPVEFVDCDGAEALDNLAGEAVDIVLLDTQLADHHSEAICSKASGLQPSPLIVMTGSAAAKPNGADVLLAKPASVDEGKDLIERCVKARLRTRILVVDDSSTMRNIVRKILSASRYPLDVSEAAEGIAALNALSSGKADIVLLDYNMPGFNGIETLAEIKRVAPDVAVVMMTSTLDESVVQRAQTQGALAFLKKPFYPADIEVVLKRYFGLE